MMKPTVTVIIPNYNHARYLPQRIDSVLQQTYQHLEVLLMDDCSQDDSRRVIADYAARDPRIRVVLNEQNSGSTFKQWNKGIALATGDYIWLAESDDVADLTFLEKLVQQLEATPQAGLAYCQSWRIDEHGQPHGTWGPILAELDATLWTQNFVLPGTELVRRFMVFSNIIPNASAVVMRRSALAAVGQAPETMRVAGDWVFWVRYLLSTDVVFVAEALNHFRFHQNNVRSRTEQDGTQLVEMAQVIKLITQVTTPEPRLYQQAIDRMMERWMHGLVYYQMPAERHQRFLKLMEEAIPGFRWRLLRRFAHFLVRNRLSGTKMLIGDKLLGRHTAAQPKPKNN
jgi:glycosyltransferase involved in cell wall biosynthesis